MGEAAGPGPSDVSSVFHMYHNSLDPQHGAAAGLQGVVIVDRPNSTYIDNKGVTRPIGITNEIVMHITELWESYSPLYKYNVENIFPAQFPSLTPQEIKTLKDDLNHVQFQPLLFLSAFGTVSHFNAMALNGYGYDNHIPNGTDINSWFKEYISYEGTWTRWYVYDIGGNAHPFHWSVIIFNN